MANNVKVELNSAGIRELLKSQEIKAECMRQAEERARWCGDGYSVSAHDGRNRINVSVFAETPAARADNLKNNTLVRSIKS